MASLGGHSAAACAGQCHATYPNGDSLTLLGDKEKRFSVGATFTYMSNLRLGLAYTRYLGAPSYQNNPLGDRDNIALNVTYDF
jgi:predicted porin